MFVIRLVSLVCLIVLPLNCFVGAWDTEDFEIFDLVEEVGININFYDVYEVAKDASNLDIRKAYRKLSLKFHPDHNKDENAEQQFRQIVSIYDVLRDDVKRKKYDNVLEVGLPDWRHPAYYYRKVRKVGLLELTGILFIISTVGQWIVSWAIYLERKFEMEEVLTSRLKKRDKKRKKTKPGASDDADDIIAEELSLLEKPRYKDLLPFIIGRGFISAAYNLPQFYKLSVEAIRDFIRRRSSISAAAPTEGAAGSGLAGVDDIAEVKKPRRKHVFELPEGADELPAANLTLCATFQEIKSFSEFQGKADALISEGRSWTEEDVASLTKAMSKYPSGCAGRWDRIAELLRRSAQDVAAMAKGLKSSTAPKAVSAALQGVTADKLSHLTVQVDRLSQRDIEGCEQRDKGLTITNGTAEDVTSGVKLSSDDGWSQVQQKTLELALVQFPKGTDERWDRISQCIGGKTKEECMLRFKHLAELVKKRRQVQPK